MMAVACRLPPSPELTDAERQAIANEIHLASEVACEAFAEPQDLETLLGLHVEEAGYCFEGAPAVGVFSLGVQGSLANVKEMVRSLMETLRGHLRRCHGGPPLRAAQKTVHARDHRLEGWEATDWAKASTGGLTPIQREWTSLGCLWQALRQAKPDLRFDGVAV